MELRHLGRGGIAALDRLADRSARGDGIAELLEPLSLGRELVILNRLTEPAGIVTAA